MKLATERRMARRRAHSAPVGLTSNGVLLVNILSLLSEREAAEVVRSLPTEFGKDFFVGAAVTGPHLTQIVSRLDDAAAEAAARIGATRRRPRKRRSTKK
jgi:hypothetical protein